MRLGLMLVFNGPGYPQVGPAMAPAELCDVGVVRKVEIYQDNMGIDNMGIACRVSLVFDAGVRAVAALERRFVFEHVATRAFSKKGIPLQQRHHELRESTFRGGGGGEVSQKTC